MAGGNITALAPGVSRTECDWGYYIDGKKDDLLCSGFAKESWFESGERGCGRIVRTTDTKLEGRDARFTQHFNGNCQITVWFTQVEMDDRAAADEAAKAQARMRKKLEAMPKSAEAYRERIIDAVSLRCEQRGHGTSISRHGWPEIGTCVR